MTVSYALKVTNSRFGVFSKLPFRWKGSSYKLLYKEFVIFVVLYAVLGLTYQWLLTKEQKRLYPKVAQYCNRSTDLIPMSFVLGFYITLVVNGWWAQYTSIPLPDQLMCVMSSNVHSKDEHTLIRYANLSAVLILRSISTRVLKRSPTMDHVVEAISPGKPYALAGDRPQKGSPPTSTGAMVLSLCPAAGFMTRDERKEFESLHSDFNKYWIPRVWFSNLAAQARQDSRICDDAALRLVTDELNLYRAKCSMLFHYDWISIPQVYRQVVTIPVYSFAFCLIGWQFLELGQEGDLDMYVPLSTLLQFYAGWLKVAEQIINPFEDDDDFETNKLIDRNLQVSLLSVDDMYQNLPHALKDKYWKESTAQPLYTTATSAETLKPSFLGFTFDERRVLQGINSTRGLVPTGPNYSEQTATPPCGAALPSPSGAWELRWVMDELLEQGRGIPELLPACQYVGWRGTCEDAEQSQLEASRSIRCIQTPLLMLLASASPAINIINFSWGGQGHPNLRPLTWGDGSFLSPDLNHSEDPKMVAHIEEDTEDEDSGAREPTMPGGHPGGTWPPEAS
ncbi:LOW QUALITY PROTEIN: bestrophin-4 [Rhynochetos jubatus]